MHDKEFEERLVEWVKSQRERKLRVSRRLIQIQAQKMTSALTNEDDEEIVFKVFFNFYGRILLQQAHFPKETDSLINLFDEVDLLQDEENGYLSDSLGLVFIVFFVLFYLLSIIATVKKNKNLC